MMFSLFSGSKRVYFALLQPNRNERMGILRGYVQEESDGLPYLEWKYLSVSLILLFITRTLYLLYSVRKIRQMRDPRTTAKFLSASTSSATTQKEPLKTLVVLGSGGHTTEMLELMKKLDPVRYKPMVLVVASTDATSLKRVQAYPHPLPIQNKDHLIETRYITNGIINEQQVYRIPRSREVGQSYFSSIFTTSYSFIFAFWLVGYQVGKSSTSRCAIFCFNRRKSNFLFKTDDISFSMTASSDATDMIPLTAAESVFFSFLVDRKQVQPDLVLINGPGTCVPVALSAFLIRIIGWKRRTKIVFVESFCRVTRWVGLFVTICLY